VGPPPPSRKKLDSWGLLEAEPWYTSLYKLGKGSYKPICRASPLAKGTPRGFREVGTSPSQSSSLGLGGSARWEQPSFNSSGEAALPYWRSLDGKPRNQ
jgi:hypothetical protein